MGAGRHALHVGADAFRLRDGAGSFFELAMGLPFILGEAAERRLSQDGDGECEKN